MFWYINIIFPIIIFNYRISQNNPNLRQPAVLFITLKFVVRAKAAKVLNRTGAILPTPTLPLTITHDFPPPWRVVRTSMLYCEKKRYNRHWREFDWHCIDQHVTPKKRPDILTSYWAHDWEERVLVIKLMKISSYSLMSKRGN